MATFVFKLLLQPAVKDTFFAQLEIRNKTTTELLTALLRLAQAVCMAWHGIVSRASGVNDGSPTLERERETLVDLVLGFFLYISFWYFCRSLSIAARGKKEE